MDFDIRGGILEPISCSYGGMDCKGIWKDLDSLRILGASLVVQWLGIRLPMQGTRVRALVWEDPTCRGATKPVSHNYCACASGA